MPRLNSDQLTNQRNPANADEAERKRLIGEVRQESELVVYGEHRHRVRRAFCGSQQRIDFAGDGGQPGPTFVMGRRSLAVRYREARSR